MTWTPFDFAVAITLASAGVMFVIGLMLLAIQPLITIGDWLDMRLKTWWKDK